MGNSSATMISPVAQPRPPQRRILVVESDLHARAALVELLAEEDYAVEAAADASQALVKVAQFGPDLVLTDLRMPGTDGLQLMERLQQANADLPVVVMTAFSEADAIIRELRSGARDCLSKPIMMRELLRVIARELGRSLTMRRAM